MALSGGCSCLSVTAGVVLSNREKMNIAGIPFAPVQILRMAAVDVMLYKNCLKRKCERAKLLLSIMPRIFVLDKLEFKEARKACVKAKIPVGPIRAP